MTSPAHSDSPLSLDVKDFRPAMARVPAPVTIVTTLDEDGRPAGFTASSVCSLSLDPPLLLVCVNKAALCYPIFRRAGRFAVNVLAVGQEDLALRFARRGADKFGGECPVNIDGELPFVSGAAAWFECALYDVLDGGDHAILVGCIERAPVADAEPMVYCHRRFGRLE